MNRSLMQNKGFTIIEMVVVMAIFVIVIMITGEAFNTILKHSSRIVKSEESNIEGVIALEMFRHDLSQAGYGLPYLYQSIAPVYKEAGYVPASSLNDAPSGVPRAFVSLNNLTAGAHGTTTASGGVFNFIEGCDYLSIKGTSLGINTPSQRWSYSSYSGATYGSKPPKMWPSDNLKAGDRVIVLRRRFSSDGTYSNQLAYDTSTPDIYWVNFNTTSGFTAAFSPTVPEELVYIYGISSSGNLGMPFNRTDYFVSTPSDATQFPGFCAPGTGILYKATVRHSSLNPGGQLNYIPLMDCVADMQVVYHWDLVDSSGTVLVNDLDPTLNSDAFGDNVIDTLSNADGSVVSGPASTAQVQAAMTNAGHIRTKLKKIQIFVLAQNGKKDSNYTSPLSYTVGDIASLGRTYPVTDAMKNYHWKMYRINVIPKNLASNQ